jgi:hypothetical protein
VTALLLAVYLFRSPLLRGLACVLIHESALAADHVLLLSGDQALDQAARFHRSQPAGRILLVTWKPGRLERAGLVPSHLVVQRTELRARGVPPGAIEVLPGLLRSDHDVARQVKAWLFEHPAARVQLLCQRFDSRRLSVVFGRIIGEEVSRIGFLALPDREYDEASWWRHKSGQMDFVNAALRLVHARFSGEDEEEPLDWDPDEYERSLP